MQPGDVTNERRRPRVNGDPASSSRWIPASAGMTRVDDGALLRALSARARAGACRRAAAPRRDGDSHKPTAASRSQGRSTLAYRANLESRLASRILWRVGGGRYRDEQRCARARARRSTGRQHFRADRTLRVDVAATRSPLTSLEFATLHDQGRDRATAFARKRACARRSTSARPDVRVHAYLTDRDATFYLDTSGEPLFKRGYRRDAEEAPLRENLAAGLVALSGWTAGHAAARSDVRQRHDRDRGRADRGRPRAGPCAHVRLPEARVVRRPDVAAHPSEGARPRRRSIRRSRRSSRAISSPAAVAKTSANARRAKVDAMARASSGRRADAARARARRRPDRQSALRRAARRTSRGSPRSIRSSATR